jgi:hypothetical protein
VAEEAIGGQFGRIAYRGRLVRVVLSSFGVAPASIEILYYNYFMAMGLSCDVYSNYKRCIEIRGI